MIYVPIYFSYNTNIIWTSSLLKILKSTHIPELFDVAEIGTTSEGFSWRELEASFLFDQFYWNSAKYQLSSFSNPAKNFIFWYSSIFKVLKLKNKQNNFSKLQVNPSLKKIQFWKIMYISTNQNKIHVFFFKKNSSKKLWTRK